MANELDVRALRYFMAVAENGSYSRAASQLRVTQPAISRQLQSLERTLKTRLFRRDGRMVKLTETGETLAKSARHIVHEIDQLHDVVGEAAREPAGRLSLGMPLAAGEQLLPEIIKRFREKYPKVFLHVTQGSTDMLADALVTGNLDLAVVYGSPRRAELELTALVTLELGLIAPAGRDAKHPVLKRRQRLSLKEVAELPLILPSRGQALRDVFEKACRSHRLSPNVAMEVDSVGLSLELVQAGQGCTILARGAVLKEERAGSLRYLSIAQPRLEWPMSLAAKRDKHLTLALRAMIDEVSLTIRETVRGPSWGET